MRFVIFKLLLEISRPIILIYLLLLISLFTLHRQKIRRGKRTLALTFILLFFFSTSALNSKFLERLEHKFAPIGLSEAPEVDVIVVLGGSVTRRTTTSSLQEEPNGSRLAYAARLYHLKKAPWIVVTGGNPYRTTEGLIRTESNDMKEYLMSFQIPESRILEEPKARNTEENAFYTLPILKKRNFKKIILVTSAFHMHRAMLWFKRGEIEIIPFPTDFKSDQEFSYHQLLPTSEAMNNFSLAAKEYLGILTFHLFH